MSDIILWLITLALFGIGLVGVFIPGLPGIGLIFAGILVYAIATDFTTISLTLVVVFGIIGALALLSDYVGSAVGARVGGGKGKTLLGTTLGAIGGLLVANVPGLLVGAFAGALVGARMEGKTTQQAAKIALASVLGVLGATVVQFILGIIMIIGFFIAIAG